MKKLAALTAAVALVAVFGFSGTAHAAFTFPFDGDLVAYYPFDDEATDATDVAGSYDGTITGAQYDCADKPATPGNQCSLDFDGVDDIVTVTAEEPSTEDTFDLTTFTLAFWFNLQGLSNENAWPRPVAKGNYTTSNGSYSIFVNDVNKNDIGLRVIDEDPNMLDTRNAALSYAQDEWHHVAATFDSSTCEGKLYFDGLEVASETFGSPCVPGDVGNPFTMGGADGLHRLLNGKLDEVRIYDVALSAADIAQLSAPPLSVSIDIKPGSDPNSINLCSKGTVPVAIFGSADFDVIDIDTVTLTLAGAGVAERGRSKQLISIEDINDDGFDDMVVHFETVGFDALDSNSTEATLMGILTDGTPFEGTDFVNIVRDDCL